MCFRPIRLSNIRLPIGIMLSRLIIYHDNLANWTFSLLSHMLMSNNLLTTRQIGHYKQLIQQKVQSFQISQQFWIFYLILLLVRSNPPHFLTQFGLPHASSPLQRPIRKLHSTCQSFPHKSSVRMKSGGCAARFQTAAQPPDFHFRKASPLKLSLINLLLFHFPVDICPKQRITH